MLLQPCVYLLNFNIAVTGESNEPQAEDAGPAAAAAEDEAQEDASTAAAAATPDARPVASCEDNKENSLAADLDLFPPTPTSVNPIVQFTVNDTINMDTSAARKEDDISLIVHVDETATEFDDTISNVSGTSLSTSTRAQTPVSGGAPAKDAAVDSATTTPTTTDTTSPGCGGAALKSESKDSVEVDIVLMADESIEDVSQRSDDTTATRDGATEAAAGATSADSKNVSANDKTAESASEQEKTGKNETSAAEKDADDAEKGSSSRNLWISGLASTTRATDLKTVFSKYGKVAGAKVVTNARSPMSKCYGFVTMNTAEEASKCIQYLHRTELHGKMISVERAKADPSQGKPGASDKPGSSDDKSVDKRDDRRAMDSRHRGRHHERSYRKHSTTTTSSTWSRSHSRHGSGERTSSRRRSDDRTKKATDGIDKSAEVDSEKSTKDDVSKTEQSKSDDKTPATGGDREASARDSKDRDKEDGRKKPKDKEMLSLDKIKEERERERLRLRERRLREEERRRREMLERDRMRQRDLMVRQREEAVKLQRERDRLRFERERLEREKLEAERERIRFEREKRERERHELAEQRRMEALRYEERQRAMKRPYDRQAPDEYWGSPKRANFDPPRYSNVDERDHRASGRPAPFERPPPYGGERPRERTFDRNTGRFEDRPRDDRREREERHGPSSTRYSRFENERNRRDLAPPRPHAPAAAASGRAHDARRASPPHRSAREASPLRRDKPSRESHRETRPSGAERPYTHGSGSAGGSSSAASRKSGGSSWQPPPARRSHDKQAQSYSRGAAPATSVSSSAGARDTAATANAAYIDGKSRVLMPVNPARVPSSQYPSSTPALARTAFISPPVLQAPHPAAAAHPLIITTDIIRAGLGASLAPGKQSDAARYSAYAPRRY